MGAYDDPKVPLPVIGQAAKGIEAFYRSMTAVGNSRLQSITQAEQAAERAALRTRKFEKETYGGSIAQGQVAKNKVGKLEKTTGDIFKGDQSRANLELMRDNFHKAVDKAGGQDASKSKIMEITAEFEQQVIDYKQSLEVFSVGFEKYRELIEIEGNADNAIMEGLNPNMIGIYERMNDPNATGEIGIVQDPSGSGDFIVADFTLDNSGKVIVNAPTTTTTGGVTTTTGTVPANLSQFKRDLGYDGDTNTIGDLEYFQQVTALDKQEGKKFLDEYLQNNLNTGSSSIAQITQVPVMVKNQQGAQVQASTPSTSSGTTPKKKFREKITLNPKEMDLFLTTQKGIDMKNALFGGDDMETVYRSTYVLDPVTGDYVPPKDANGNVLTPEQATNQIIYDLYK